MTSIRVVMARSYSRYSGRTTEESETWMPGCRAATSSPTRFSCAGLA